MIRHPNYSGMQMNQLTGLYIPAKYVSEIDVRQGSDLVFRIGRHLAIRGPQHPLQLRRGRRAAARRGQDSDGRRVHGELGAEKRLLSGTHALLEHLVHRAGQARLD